jgi:diacylglycerol kinase (ATP)
MRITLVVNPAAGGGRGRRTLDRALPHLRAHGLDPQVHLCTNGREPELLARESAEAGSDIVVAVGGDGQARSVANGLLGTSAAMGLLPAGSANDYARAVGVPRSDVIAATDLLLSPRVAQVDVVRVESDAVVEHFLNVGGAGFDSVVAATAEGIRFLRGSPRYVLAVLRELPRFRAGHFSLTADGTKHDFRGMIVAVANGSTYGGGMRVAPTAGLQSGMLEACIVGELSRLAFLRAFPSVFRGTHVTHPAVTMLRARVMEISAEPSFEVTGDGERIGRLPATFTLLPAALPVVVGPRVALRWQSFHR